MLYYCSVEINNGFGAAVRKADSRRFLKIEYDVQHTWSLVYR